MADSKKISQFTTENIVSNSDLFTFVRNGTNLNVPFSQFKSSLGVTGTLQNVGGALDVPVLDQLNSVNSFRKLKSSKGVLAQINANNGITLSNNFVQSTVGASIIADLNADQYRFKTLTGGLGVNLTEKANTIEIDFSPTASATKTVVVAEESDFPAPVSGVITLEPDADYLITEDIVTSNRFVVSRPNTIRASSSQMVTLRYTGTGNMFTGVNPNFKIVNITIDAPNGHIYSTTAPSAPGIVQMVESNIESCQTLGTIDGNFITRFTNVAFENLILGGLTMSGANEVLVVDVGIAFLMGGSLLDLGSATFNAISIESGVIPVSGVGTFFLSGLPNSGNINPGGLGTVINNKGFGLGSSLNGISTDDARWNFFANNSIADTRPDALLTFNTPTTTVLTAATPAKVTGSWTEERSSQMTTDASGRAAYDGEKPATLPVTLTISCQPVSGTNKDINIYLAKNGVVIPNSKVITTISSGAAKNQSIAWQDVFFNGDYYEAWIESVDGTDVQVNSAKLRVN